MVYSSKRFIQCPSVEDWYTHSLYQSKNSFLQITKIYLVFTNRSRICLVYVFIVQEYVMRSFCIEKRREKKKNSRRKFIFPQNEAHKKRKSIDVKEILAFGISNPTAPMDGTSIDNTHRNAMDRLVSGKRECFVVIRYRLNNNHDADTFLLLLKRVP